MKATIRIDNAEYDITGDDLKEAVTAWINSNRSKLRLGNVAGSRIVSAKIVPEPWYRGNRSGVWSNGDIKNYKEQKAFLVIQHLGMDLAHKPASQNVIESKFLMSVPIGTQEIELE